MKTSKYVMSGGLAFSEEEDMEKLSTYAKAGWILEGFAPFGYKLRKDEPQNIIYSIDYREDADQEYFTLFEDAGWTNVCSSGNAFHMFRAAEGTKPIYSDKESVVERYEREKSQSGKFALPLLIITIVFFLLGTLSIYGLIPEIAGNIALTLGYVSLIMLVFPGLPYIAYRLKLNKLKKC